MIPDIVTSAKGLTGSWQPLSMVAIRQKLKDFFNEKPSGWGSTFQAHPVALACGYAALPPAYTIYICMLYNIYNIYRYRSMNVYRHIV